MNLREIAAEDAAQFLGDHEDGFGWPVKIMSPDGTVVELSGRVQDIALAIDPDTQQTVSGRTASVTVSMKALGDAGLVLPRHVPDKGARPWLVEVVELNGTPRLFKVIETRPDRMAGVVQCMLARYRR